MTRIPLSGGAYQAHSVIAAAQRQVNLYSEPMPPASTEPQPVALYPTPGLRLLGTMGQAGIRGGCQASNGNVYVVAGSGVYSVGADWTGTLLGSITTGKHTPVSMVDNGLDLVIVDGSANGWHVTLASNAFAQISDPTGSFRGGDRVDFLDTYFVFNVPGTPQFEASDSLALTFDPLWFANKEGFSDLLATLVVAKRQIWLLGTKTAEIFFNAGAADFPFQSFPNVIIDHGCVAKYSAAEIDNAVYWLAQDRRGQGFVLQGAGYETTRVTTFAIEQEMATYDRIDDAIGFTYFLAGHLFYVLTFPTADRTWSYDISTKEWHEWLWIDSNGSEHRHRANCCFAARGLVVAGDWQNGRLYAVDPAVYTDNGGPIKRLRRYPHMLADGRRVYYRQFLADMETGTATPTALVPDDAYAVTGANLGVLATVRYALESAAPETFPATYRYAVMSMWLQTDVADSGFFFEAAFGAGGVDVSVLGAAWPGVAPDGLIQILLTADHGGTQIGSAEFTGTVPSGGLHHLLISVDSVGQIAQCYLDDAALPVAGSTVWNTPAVMVATNSTSEIRGGLQGGGPGGNADVEYCAGDLWHGHTTTFLDLTVTANRRLFINADLSPVDLGADGSGPTGTSPEIWLSIRTPHTPAEVLTNRGTGGADFTGLDGQTPLWCFGPDVPGDPVQSAAPQVFLAWSDDRGRSFSNPVGQSLGAIGEYRTSLQWQRLGMARDRVFEIEWSTPASTALQGAWIDAQAADS